MGIQPKQQLKQVASKGTTLLLATAFLLGGFVMPPKLAYSQITAPPLAEQAAKTEQAARANEVVGADEVANNVIEMTIGSKKTLINGKAKIMEATPYLEKDTTMVPLRFICEAILSCQVDYVEATKKINLTNSRIKAVVDISKGTVLVTEAGEEPRTLKLPVAPQIKNDFTYMPLRFFAQLFHCQVDYNSVGKGIRITGGGGMGLPGAGTPGSSDQLPTTQPDVNGEAAIGAPIAQMGFLATVAGQPIQYVDSSYDPSGSAITASQWMVSRNGKLVGGTDINALLKAAKAGSYTVYYRVKNDKGLWSNWALYELFIATNELPVVKDFRAIPAKGSNTAINQGEAVDFSYTVENETWEQITDTKWSYTWLDKGKSRTIHSKPSAFFSADVYDVTISVKDAYGNWSNAVTVKVTPTETKTQSEARFKFDNLIAGEIFLNSINHNFNDFVAASPYNIRNENVSLLASNNPETVTENGILCQDTLSGDIRLRYHHKNSTPINMRVGAIAHNRGTTPVTIVINNYATAGPSQDVIQVGCSVVENFLVNGKPMTTKVLQPGEVYLINSGIPILKPDDSSAGLIELNASGPLQFTIVAMQESTSYKNYQHLAYVAKNSTHIRGTFPNATINLSYTLSGNQPEKIILGREDAYHNYFVKGMDQITGLTLVNNGNRGVVHKMTIRAEGKVALLFNPRGAMYKGVIKNMDGSITHLSTAGLMTGIKESCVIGVIEAGEVKTLTYLAPSGSDTPLLIVAIPYADLDQY